MRPEVGILGELQKEKKAQNQVKGTRKSLEVRYKRLWRNNQWGGKAVASQKLRDEENVSNRRVWSAASTAAARDEWWQRAVPTRLVHQKCHLPEQLGFTLVSKSFSYNKYMFLTTPRGGFC